MKPDGGPAFARTANDHQPGTMGFDAGAPGMSLRDYFAAAALQHIGFGKAGMSLRDIAALAFDTADAMLAERSKL